MLRTPSLLGKNPYFESNRKFLEEMLLSVPFVGGDSRAQKVQNYVKNIRGNHYKKSRDYFGKTIYQESRIFVHFIRN